MSNKTVYMCPTPTQARLDTTNSIHQIVLHLERELPRYGYELTENADSADIRAGHAGQTYGYNNIEVAHCHGLYPTHLFPNKVYFGANKNVIHHLKTARAITVPSEWVADIIRREMNVNPYVINWGIVAKDWKGGKNEKYTLWNKTRVDNVCDPSPMLHLANAYPENQFVTTFAGTESPPQNVRVTGRIPYLQMMDLIKNCGVYLATTKETFGIGTLEALAAGKPVLGYEWGATPDIVQHGVNGFLAKPDDIEGLKAGLFWVWRHYGKLAQNAITTALSPVYSWSNIAWKFARVYDAVLAKVEYPIPVSVVIPCYNYGKYIHHAVNSVTAQKTDFIFEIIVINDASTDDSGAICKQLVAHYAAQGVVIRYVENEANLHVAETRNKAINIAQGQYIVCLDADDKLGDISFLQTLYDYMRQNPQTGVAYTGLGLFTIDGGLAKKSEFPPAFDIEKQLSGRNQVPTCNMFLKEAWARAGGYRKYQQPAEDAALWTSIACLGYSIHKVTDNPMFMYRWHEESLSSDIRRGVASEPYWRRQWHSAIEIKAPFPSVQAPKNGISHPVNNYDVPLISIVIPVGKGHELDVIRAIDSVQSQTFLEYECIVINDTGKPLFVPHTWVRVVETSGNRGAGAARNAGVDIAKGEFIVFLDADDMLLPDFLDETLKAYKRSGRYVYTNWYGQRGKALTETKSSDYAQNAILTKSSIHAITALIPKIWITGVGGFDTTLFSWEDSDFFMKLAVSGFCGVHLNKALFIYNYESGKRREVGVNQKSELVLEFNRRFEHYRTGEKKMCQCNDLLNAKSQDIDWGAAVKSGEMVRVEMVKGGAAKVHVVGGATKQTYGRRQVGDVFYMYAEDAKAAPDTFKPIGNAPLQLTPTEFPTGKPKRLIRNG